MDRGIEQPLPPALRRLPIARVFLDVWNEPRVEDRFAVAPGIEPAIEIEIRTVDLQIRQSGHALQGVQSVRKEHGIGFIHPTRCGFPARPARWNLNGPSKMWSRHVD